MGYNGIHEPYDDEQSARTEGAVQPAGNFIGEPLTEEDLKAVIEDHIQYPGLDDGTTFRDVKVGLREPLAEAGIQEPVNDVPVAASGGTAASANTFGPRFLIESSDPEPEFSVEQHLRLQALQEAKLLLQRTAPVFSATPEIDPEDLLLVGHYILTGQWLDDESGKEGNPIIDEAAGYFAAQDAKGGATVMAQHLRKGDVFAFPINVGRRWIVLSNPKRTADEKLVTMRVQFTSNPNHAADDWCTLAETAVRVFHQTPQ